MQVRLALGKGRPGQAGGAEHSWAGRTPAGTVEAACGWAGVGAGIHCKQTQETLKQHKTVPQTQYFMYSNFNTSLADCVRSNLSHCMH